MTRKDALKFCALIELEYPKTYRDLDNEMQEAVVKNWQATFSSVHFLVMQMAFDAFRKKSKYPPKTVDMITELHSLNSWAKLTKNDYLSRDDEDLQKRCAFIIAQTEFFSREQPPLSMDLLQAIPDDLLEVYNTPLLEESGGLQ